MNKPRLISGVATVALCTTAIVLHGIQAKRSGESGPWITTMLIAATAAVVLIGLLYAIERFLVKTKSAAWMSRFHICLAAAFAVAIAILVVYMLCNYA